MIGIYRHPRVYVGFDKIAKLFENNEACKRFSVEDRQFELVRGPGLADPLDDALWCRIVESIFPFVEASFWGPMLVLEGGGAKP